MVTTTWKADDEMSGIELTIVAECGLFEGVGDGQLVSAVCFSEEEGRKERSAGGSCRFTSSSSGRSQELDQHDRHTAGFEFPASPPSFRSPAS